MSPLSRTTWDLPKTSSPLCSGFLPSHPPFSLHKFRLFILTQLAFPSKAIPVIAQGTCNSHSPTQFREKGRFYTGINLES